jgi:hypothetical protein
MREPWLFSVLLLVPSIGRRSFEAWLSLRPRGTGGTRDKWKLAGRRHHAATELSSPGRLRHPRRYGL